MKRKRKAKAADLVVFPCVLEVLPDAIFRNKDPMILGCRVTRGLARLGTPLCVPLKGELEVGRIVSMQKD